MKKKKLSLPLQILIALVLGVIVGLICYFSGEGAQKFTGDYLKPLGDIFVNLLKFIVVPVVLLSMIDGILSMNDMKKVGSVGVKTVVFFMITTAIACVIGLVFANIFKGAGWFPDLSGSLGAAEYEAKEFGGFMSTLVGIFPSNMWAAFSSANMLQVIVIALFFGGSILAVKDKEKKLTCTNLVSSLYAVIERLMMFVISLSPIGVFTYMSWVVATQGAEILGSLALVILCAYIGYVVHALVVYSVAASAFAKINPLKFFKGAFAAMIFAFTSTSSAATLPVSKECAEDLGAEGDVAAFVLPLGSTINMDGTAIYQCVATVFIASCAGMNLTLGQMITVVVTATLASIGTAGVSGAGMIMLAMVLEAINIPVEYIGLIVAVDRLFDMGRTCLNVTGDISCSLCVSAWERKKAAGKSAKA
ncbi:MAG: dicarboxylate/amino acid:cation symporter [Oscillospiraceae bacterium]|nr:dicarboxylate/amino acid:cation symporter [Oscillospiraceae bacterium]